jgi:hypothetical protein
LSNILYVPSISKNLLSIGALIDEGKVVVFTKMHFLVWDNLKGRNILATSIRQRSNGLYKLTLEPETNLVTSEDRSRIWHQCYGHLYYRRLTHLSTYDRVQDMPKLSNFYEVCEVCQARRQTRVR